MNKKKKIVVVFILLLGLLAIYPSFILGYTLSHVARSDFPGGRNGPLDAYRHTLASALVAYTLNEEAVSLVTKIMESKNRNSNLMDRHNNRIGARIGISARAFSDIEPTVRDFVSNGKVNSTNENQVTWLSANRWADSWIW